MCRSDHPMPPTKSSPPIAGGGGSSSHANESVSINSSDDDDDLLSSTQSDDDDDSNYLAAVAAKNKEDDDQDNDHSDDSPVWIACGRTFVFMGMFLMGVMVSAITFASLSNVSYTAYMATYTAAVKTLELSSNSTMTTLLTSAETLADSLSKTAGAAGGYSLDTFDEQATLARLAIKSPLAMWSPLLATESELNAWNDYSSSQEATASAYPVVFDNLLNPTPATTLPVAPISQTSPAQSMLVNFNMRGVRGMDEVARRVGMAKAPVFTETLSHTFLEALELLEHNKTAGANHTAPPTSFLIVPVLGQQQSNKITGFVQVVVPWETLVQESLAGIVVVLTNTCGQQHTYMLQEDATAVYLGDGDLHDKEYASSRSIISLNPMAEEAANIRSSNYTCSYSLAVYSSDEFYSDHMSKLAYTVTFVMAFIFTIFVLAFFMYDHLLARHNKEVSRDAMKADEILSSLFPSHVKNRLMTAKGQEGVVGKDGKGNHGKLSTMETTNLAGFFANGGHQVLDTACKPIADLFPDTTVLFADIAGFTAWSSVREPSQVFTLLETVFNAFDENAKRRRVYKVETVGDCYVAVTGLPLPQKDHAVILCRFAKECIKSFHKLSRQLETKLGPDTADLDLRVGLHSGQVTGGVLRGERSRFQLFGDTMNTAARMEQSGVKGKIHISQETVDLLIAAGKTQWITPREDMVVAKGKGELRTYWLTIGSSDAGTIVSGSDTCSNIGSDDASVTSLAKEKNIPATSSKTTRLIEWNCDVLIRLLKQIVVRRKILLKRNPNRRADADESIIGEGSVIDEVKEIISLPTTAFGSALLEADDYVLPANVIEQLYDYVTNIAAMYRQNPFHSFEHGSHVTMSVTKLLSRIVAPTGLQATEAEEDMLHCNSYGITSDPLTQFSVVLSALIHDVDHPGIPNSQLLKEDSQLADYYKNQSMAEQNSVDLAWHLLMDEAYSDLRKTIYTTQDGLNRFRQLIVNSVMATDIMDKDLKALRNKRWDVAFSPDTVDADPKDTVNRKATIVIEHLIQASDVAHTMQHWHVYRRWNERFYEECYKAYKEGRAESDPTDSWYRGELGFYDFYIIPLAKKLKDCGVFGVASDEYLNYAQRNRMEWEARGQEIVQEMIEKIRGKYECQQ